MITRLFPNCEAEKNISPTPKENCETLPKRNPFESLPNLPSPFELQVDMLEWTPSGSAHLLALIEEAVQESEEMLNTLNNKPSVFQRESRLHLPRLVFPHSINDFRISHLRVLLFQSNRFSVHKIVRIHLLVSLFGNFHFS